MNSLHRLMRILDIFEEGDGVFTADQLLEKLGYTRSTTYRYLKVLSDAGLLSSWHGNGYALGPRVIEFATLINKRDPLLLASRPEMQSLTRNVAGVAILCRRYRDRLLCVHTESSAPTLPLPATLGRSGPLMGNCASRVILSRFPAQQLRKYYDSNGLAFGESGLGGTLPEVRSRLRAIRDQGYDFDTGADDDAPTAYAAPVLDSMGMPIASVTLAVPTRAAKADIEAMLPRHVVDVSQNICRAIAA